MKLLLIHSKTFQYTPIQPAVKEPEELREGLREQSFENALVVFTSVENGDDSSVVEKARDEILSAADQVKPSVIVLYPYAHLSSDLAPPSQP